MSELISIAPYEYKVHPTDVAAIAGTAGMHGIVLSCPDYGDDGRVATFDRLGGDVPIMVRQHLGALSVLADTYSSAGNAFSLNKVTILVADTEADNPLLADQFTNGDAQEFRRKVAQSVDAVRTSAAELVPAPSAEANTFTGGLVGSGKDPNGYLDVRQHYTEYLNNQPCSYLQTRLRRAVRYKMKDPHYQATYADMSESEIQQSEAIVLAEYIAIGHVVHMASEPEHYPPLIVVHSSPNTDLLNYYSKTQNVARIPLLVRHVRKVA